MTNEADPTQPTADAAAEQAAEMHELTEDELERIAGGTNNPGEESIRRPLS